MRKFDDPGKISRMAKRKRVGAFVAGLALVSLLVGTAIGRYQNQFRSDSSVRALNFYFTSPFLDGGTHTLAPGSTEVSFTLGNHADELRFSEVDITYEVTVEPSAGITVTYGNSAKTLDKDNKQDDTVTIQGLKPGGTYTVQATGTCGYEQILTATVEVLSVEPAVYMHLDTTNSAYVLLTVWAQNYKGAVTITPPAWLIPDNTDPVMATVQTGQPFTDAASFQTSGYSSHTYRFFGSGVTAEQFQVTYDGGKNATEKAPS